MNNDSKYWKERADEEFVIAGDCSSKSAAAIHRRLGVVFGSRALEMDRAEETVVVKNSAGESGDVTVAGALF